MDEEIHVLVNNVSICYPKERPQYFTEIPNLSKFIESIINVNINACTRLTALVLPRMVAKGRGTIINLSSMSALYPTPYWRSTRPPKYTSITLPDAYTRKNKSKGIVIQSLIPAYVSTNMSHNMKPGMFVPTAHDFVNHALKTVAGSRDRRILLATITRLSLLFLQRLVASLWH